MTDHTIEWVALIIAAFAAIGTWLGVPQLQSWWRLLNERRAAVPSGEIADTSMSEAFLSAGVLKSDRETLRDIQDGLPSSSIEWLHHQNFGDGFWLSQVTRIEHFVLSRMGPEHEFLHKELEQLRLALWDNIGEFTGLIAKYTFRHGPQSGGGTWMKIWNDYDDIGNFKNQQFFQQANEINTAAERVWHGYKELIRPARLILASSDIDAGVQ